MSGKRDSNPRRQPWQGCTLPLSYSRVKGSLRAKGLEPPRLKAPDPKSGASASSATLAIVSECIVQHRLLSQELFCFFSDKLPAGTANQGENKFSKHHTSVKNFPDKKRNVFEKKQEPVHRSRNNPGVERRDHRILLFFVLLFRTAHLRDIQT